VPIKFSIELTAKYCNSWPWLQITNNNVVIYDNEIKETQSISLNITGGVLKLIGIKKNNDTQLSADNKIIQDKLLRVDKIVIDDIDMGIEFIRHLKFNNELGTEVSFLNTTFYENGEITINLQEPILSWIIEEKFIKLLSTYGDDKRMYSSVFSKFKYSVLHEKIKNLRNLIK